MHTSLTIFLIGCNSVRMISYERSSKLLLFFKLFKNFFINTATFLDKHDFYINQSVNKVKTVPIPICFHVLCFENCLFTYLSFMLFWYLRINIILLYIYTYINICIYFDLPFMIQLKKFNIRYLLIKFCMLTIKDCGSTDSV